MIECNKDCTKCKYLSGRTDDKGYLFGYECLKYGDSVFKEKFGDTKEFKINDMITWKCLRKLDKKELTEIVNDIHNGTSYTVKGWEDTYPTDEDILEYAKTFESEGLRL